jgi:hypothetical protein
VNTIKQRDATAGTPDGVIGWAPELDLSNCGVQVIGQAIAGAEEARWDPEFARVAQALGLDNVRLEPAVVALAQGTRAFLETPTVDLSVHLEQAGFAAADPASRLALHAWLGRAFLGLFNYAIRSRTRADATGESLPYAPALARLVAAFADQEARLRPVPEDEAGRLGAALDVARRYGATTVVPEHDALWIHVAGWDEHADVPTTAAARLEALGLAWDEDIRAWHMGA